MTKRSRRFSVLSVLGIALVPVWLASCAGSETSDPGTGGTTGAAGTTGVAGTTGAAGTGNTTGVAGTTGAAGTGNTTGAAGTGNVTGAAGTGNTGAAGTTGVAGTTGNAGTTGAAGMGLGGRGGTTGTAGAGQAGRGGTTGTAGAGQAGRGGTTGSAGTTGTGGGAACPDGSTTEFGCGAMRTMGYMGCSMSVNVATGYNRRGGKRMWEAISAYGGQVVQSWTPASGGVWSSFDSKATQYGKPTDIWMMICIFSSQGVTAAEVQTMIRNARAHSTPTTRIWVTGQPLYNSGHTCTLAGASGPGLTDMRAREANNPADNVFYAGQLLLDASKSQVAGDTCHASAAGEDALGDQMIAKFGK